MALYFFPIVPHDTPHKYANFHLPELRCIGYRCNVPTKPQNGRFRHFRRFYPVCSNLEPHYIQVVKVSFYDRNKSRLVGKAVPSRIPKRQDTEATLNLGKVIKQKQNLFYFGTFGNLCSLFWNKNVFLKS